MSGQPKVHLDRDGRARCGKRKAQLTTRELDVTCAMCLAIMNGTHGIGNRQPDSDHGTAARYRWHLRHEGKPVRCEPCLQAELRRHEDRPGGRDEENARRRERYAALRAAGATARQAGRRKDHRRAA